MKVWNAPPGRMSKARTSVVQGLGHHHSLSSCGSVQARQTLARGALSSREMTRSWLSGLAVFSFGIGQFLLVKRFDKSGHAVGPGFP
ncbi:hypothetical protein D3C72_2169920 [compost metagenome]